MPSNTFSNQLAALHWLINTAILCAEVRQRVPFWQQACLLFLSTYLVMLPPEIGGIHPQNGWERRTREDDSWPWRYHRTLLTSGMLLQQCQEALAKASTLCCWAETHMSIWCSSKSVSLSWTKILKLWISARNYVDDGLLLPSSSKLKQI